MNENDIISLLIRSKLINQPSDQSKPSSTIINAQIASYNVERSDVASFLSNVEYDPSDYSTSQIPNYVKSVSSNKPNVYAIENSEDTFYAVMESGSNFRTDVLLPPNPVCKNAIPGSDFILFGINSNMQLTSLFIVSAMASKCRMIDLDGVDNVRDLGGWSCDGGQVKYGMLYRGGALWKFNDSGERQWFLTSTGKFSALNTLGIRKEIDLRFASDVKDVKESGFGSTVDLLWVDMDWSDLNVQRSTGHIKQIFDPLMDWVIAGMPVYFHCSAGADRTGIVALLCESILGVSQSDCDKDYELTSFYTGVDTDAHARRRNETPWKVDAIEVINSCSGMTFRDKAVNYMLSCGITLEKINAFRAAMIDGTPEVLTPSVESYTVTRSLTNVTGSNTKNSVDQYQPFTIDLAPADGMAMTNVKVTMGGNDITSSVFKGVRTNKNFSVKSVLSNCYNSNTRVYAIAGQSYYGKISADENYSLVSPTVTMGGTNITSTAYANGEIRILEVTGDITITATANPIMRTITNNLTHCSSNNTQASIMQGSTYTSTLTANANYVLDTVTVTMGGTNITSTAYANGVVTIKKVTGNIVITAVAKVITVTYTVTKNITNCSISNAATTAVGGNSYTATVTPNSGYTISSVTITMGGEDVSNYYSNGTINIPNVSGNIVITATAVESAATYVNQLVNSIDRSGNKIGKAWMLTNSHYTANNTVGEESGTNITGLIAVAPGDTIRIRWSGNTGSHQSIKGFNSSRTPTGSSPEIRFSNIANQKSYFEVLTDDKANGKFDFVLTKNPSTESFMTEDLTNATYIAITLIESDINNVIVTINEEID